MSSQRRSKDGNSKNIEQVYLDMLLRILYKQPRFRALERFSTDEALQVALV